MSSYRYEFSLVLLDTLGGRRTLKEMTALKTVGGVDSGGGLIVFSLFVFIPTTTPAVYPPSGKRRSDFRPYLVSTKQGLIPLTSCWSYSVGFILLGLELGIFSQIEAFRAAKFREIVSLLGSSSVPNFWIKTKSRKTLQTMFFTHLQGNSLTRELRGIFTVEV